MTDADKTVKGYLVSITEVSTFKITCTEAEMDQHQSGDKTALADWVETHGAVFGKGAEVTVVAVRDTGWDDE